MSLPNSTSSASGVLITVWISRAIRSDDAATVPSRWINRLTNLLAGLPDQGGPGCLAAMRDRGDHWLDQATRLSRPEDRTAPALRPSPRPPLAARPKKLSVTRIKTLIRDPYAIYAEYVLGLRALDPLTPTADAPMRGVVIHKVMEQFIRCAVAPETPQARTRLLDLAEQVLAAECPWPTVRRLWMARIAGVADWFLQTEVQRRQLGQPVLVESWGELALTGLDFTLTAKADRFDLGPDGRVLIYDYKTGRVPSPKEQTYFDKQLLLEAAMVEQGGFAGIGRLAVSHARYIGLGPDPKEVAAPLDHGSAAAVWAAFHGLIRNWTDPARGYSSRIWMQQTDDPGHYDHLARFGEWDHSDPVTPEDVI